MITQITNPDGAYQTVTDFRTGQASDGSAIQYGQTECYVIRANATIARGEALSIVAPTATVPVSVTPMAAATAVHLYLGAAQHDAVAGEPVLVVRRGFAVVRTEAADAPAAGEVLRCPDTTTGRFAASGALGAGGEVAGTVLGPEIGTTDFAFVFLDPVNMPQTA